MRLGRLVIAAAFVLVMVLGASVAQAYTYTWGGSTTANWDAGANWTGDGGYPDSAADQGDIDSGRANANVNIGSVGDWPVINVNAGGQLHIGANNSTATIDNPITLDGGSLYVRASSTLNGTVNVASESYVTGGTDHTGDSLTLAGAITGSAKLNVNNGGRELRVGNDNSATYSGNWEVGQSGSGELKFTVDGAPGSGNVTVTSGYAYFTAAQTTAPMVTLKSNGRLLVGTGTGANALSTNVDCEGGTIGPDNTTTSELSGTVTLKGNSQLFDNNTERTKHLTISGQITESGGSYGLTKHGAGSAILSNAANNHTGDTVIKGGTVEPTAAGALSTGSVSVEDGSYNNSYYTKTYLGGRLRTSANGSLDSVVDGGGTVTVKKEGVIEFNSVETKLVTVEAGGAVRHIANQTNYNYSGGSRNLAVAAGAIIDSSVPTAPTLGELTAGDGRYGVYLGKSGTDGGTYTFRSGSELIYRGLGALNNGRVGSGANLNFTGTASSSAGPVEFYAQAGSQLDLNGCTLNPSNGRVGLYGRGEYYIPSGGAPGGSFSSINYYGTRYLKLTDNCLTGKTLNVYSGFLYTPYHPDHNPWGYYHFAGMEGATVNIQSGGILQVAKPVTSTTGQLTIKSGGGVYFGNNSFGNLDTHPTTYEKHSQVFMYHYHDPGAVTLPGAGKSDYIISGTDGRWNYARLQNGVMLLGDDCRVTYSPNWSSVAKISGTGGYIGLDTASGATKMRLTAYDRFDVDAKIDLDLDGVAGGPAGTLIVGDPSDFTMMNSSASGFVTLSQSGVVDLGNTANNIGAIHIAAGTCRATNIAYLGGATTFSGNGTLDLNNQTLALSGGSVSPGTSVGTLKVLGNLTLDGGSVLNVELKDAAEYDVLDVSGTLRLTDVELNVLPLSGFSEPVGGFTVVEAGTLNEFDMFNNDQTLIGGTTYNIKFPKGSGVIFYDYDNDEIILSDIRVSGAVPEPAGLGLIGLALLGLRKKRS